MTVSSDRGSIGVLMDDTESDLATCRHGLSYDASLHQGCVVCRREAVEDSAPVFVVEGGSDEGRSPRAVLGAFLLLGSISLAGVVLFSSLSEPSDDAPPPGRAVTTRPRAQPRERAPERRRGPVREQVHEGFARGELAEAAPEPGDSPAEVDRAPTPPAGADPAEALTRARRRVRITLYTTDWCPHCTRAKAYMDAAGISYVERDVESSETYRSRRDRLNPRRSVPTFDIGGVVLVGFGSERLERTIDEVAKRYL